MLSKHEHICCWSSPQPLPNNSSRIDQLFQLSTWTVGRWYCMGKVIINFCQFTCIYVYICVYFYIDVIATLIAIYGNPIWIFMFICENIASLGTSYIFLWTFIHQHSNTTTAFIWHHTHAPLVYIYMYACIGNTSYICMCSFRHFTIISPPWITSIRIFMLSLSVKKIIAGLFAVSSHDRQMSASPF